MALVDIQKEQILFAERFKKPASIHTGLVMLNARIHAENVGSKIIDSEDLLWGLAVDSSATPLFRAVGVNQVDIIRIIELMNRPPGSRSGEKGDSDINVLARTALMCATEHSDRLGSMLVRPADIALGLTHDQTSFGGSALSFMGATYPRMEKALSRIRGFGG